MRNKRNYFVKLNFGRHELPSLCLIYPGVYLPRREGWVKRLFDHWPVVEGHLIKYTFAQKDGKEYLVLFNVYGGQIILEVLYLLKMGGVKKIFFLGSAWGKDLPVGTIILPTSVYDGTRMVSLDGTRRRIVIPRVGSIKGLSSIMKALGTKYVAGKVVSVPIVLHKFKFLKELIRTDPEVKGVEMELSTFCHYTQKENLEEYALLYVSDNEKAHLLNFKSDVVKKRAKALRGITEIALRTIGQ